MPSSNVESIINSLKEDIVRLKENHKLELDKLRLEMDTFRALLHEACKKED